MKKSQKNSTKLFFFFPLTVLLSLTILLQLSCKKTDFSGDENNNVNKTEQFFKLPTNVNSALQRVAEELKKQNTSKEFIEEFITKQGFAIWNKASLFVKSGKHNTLPTNTTAANLSDLSDLSDTTIFIPLVLDNAKHVNGFIKATVNSEIVMRIFRNSDYANFPFATATPATCTTAEEFAIRMMMFDRDIFGYNTFSLKDKRLFNNSNDYKDTGKIKRVVDFGNNGYTLNNVWHNTCVTINTMSISNHCPYPVNRCPDIFTGVEGPCDNCQAYCANITYSSSTQCISWEEGGNESWPIIPSGGGSGGIGGGNPPPCPIMGAIVVNNAIPGCEPIPNPWPYQYQFSANDTRVINELNAENIESDLITANSDCQGTKRTGNINFNGTKEHWLIQLDYIAKNPIGGDREYAIPYSSALGNRGYADLVNTISKEIFEIKPEGLLSQGIVEANRYVAKANQFCPSFPGPLPDPNPWHKGTNYSPTRLPSTDPTKNIFAELGATGVIIYKYEPKNINPNPLPIVIPYSVLDKLKNLVDRLKINFSDADRIIAEFMHEFPELKNYIKNAAIGAAVAIIVGTIIEDIATAGAGILDDWASFTLAYRIVRFAWKL